MDNSKIYLNQTIKNIGEDVKHELSNEQSANYHPQKHKDISNFFKQVLESISSTILKHYFDSIKEIYLQHFKLNEYDKKMNNFQDGNKDGSDGFVQLPLEMQKDISSAIHELSLTIYSQCWGFTNKIAKNTNGHNNHSIFTTLKECFDRLQKNVVQYFHVFQKQNNINKQQIRDQKKVSQSPQSIQLINKTYQEILQSFSQVAQEIKLKQCCLENREEQFQFLNSLKDHILPPLSISQPNLQIINIIEPACLNFKTKFLKLASKLYCKHQSQYNQIQQFLKQALSYFIQSIYEQYLYSIQKIAEELFQNGTMAQQIEHSDGFQIYKDQHYQQLEIQLYDQMKKQSDQGLQQNELQLHLAKCKQLDYYVSQKGQIFNSLQKNIRKEVVYVRKEREKYYDQIIAMLWKQARIHFFNQIQQKINDLQKKKEMEIKTNLALDLFVKSDKRWHQIPQLQQLYQQMQEKFHKKQRECVPLQQIIKLQLDRLRVIYIQYNQNHYNQCRYQISAFDLFQVVHSNPLLSQVIIRGVKVEQFQSFIKLIFALKNHQIVQQNRKELIWMNKFNPKSVKIAIDAKIEFSIQQKDSTFSKLKYLSFFCQLFSYLGDITTAIKLGEWDRINEWGNILQDLWKCLKEIKIKSIKMKIWIQLRQVQTDKASVVQSVLFGGLASLTEITQLSFNSIKFSKYIGTDDYLDMERSLRTLFKNNRVTHLELIQCSNFPVFPEIITLQFVSLRKVSFWRQFGFMKEVVRTNRSLKYIKCWLMEAWKINEQLLNDLQTLMIWDYSIALGDISSQSSSNIKNLKIRQSKIGVESFFLIFGKLSNLNYLHLSRINFGNELICSISSPHLEELHIWYNNTITDRDLQLIDARWPYLKNITLRNCNQITNNVWSICKFKGLMRIKVNQLMFQGKGNKTLQYLKSRGIRVNQ